MVAARKEMEGENLPEPTCEDLGEWDTEVVSHSRYVIFQMAEVMVSRSLFRGILERIHRFTPVPIGSS